MSRIEDKSDSKLAEKRDFARVPCRHRQGDDLVALLLKCRSSGTSNY